MDHAESATSWAAEKAHPAEAEKNSASLEAAQSACLRITGPLIRQDAALCSSRSGRLEAVMMFGAGTGMNPFAKVKGLIRELNNRFQGSGSEVQGAGEPGFEEISRRAHQRRSPQTQSSVPWSAKLNVMCAPLARTYEEKCKAHGGFVNSL